jgi:hypothetical protein
MKIYAPVKDATGVWCSVYFKNGVGETKNPHLIEWFRNHGYRIEDEKVDLVEEIANEEVEVLTHEVENPDFESMTPIELREWMKANGLGSKIKNIRNKEKLIEIIKG